MGLIMREKTDRRWFIMVVVALLFTCTYTGVHAQSMGQKYVEYDENLVVQSLKRQYLSYYSNNEQINGWRILLSSTTDRRQMDRDLERFKRNYTGVPHTWDYNTPYYRLRVGAYTSRLEAKQALGEYKKHFSGAIEIQDKIKKEDFLK